MLRLKKYICLMLALCLLFGAVGCNSKTTQSINSEPTASVLDDTSSEETTADPENSEEPTTDPDEEPEYLPDTELDDTNIPLGLYSSAEFTLKNASAPIQKDFLGFNAIYHAYTFRSDKYDRVHTERSAKAELDAVEKSGISVARTQYSYDWAWDERANKWDFESQNMQALYRWCLELKERGIQVHLNYWYAYRELFDQYLAADYTNQTADYVYQAGTKVKAFYVEGDREKTIDNFAVFIEESIKQLRAKGCTNVTYLSLSTEPGFAYFGQEKDADRVAELYAKDFLSYSNAVHHKLTASGLRKNLTIVGPNEGAMTTPNGYMAKAVCRLDTEGAVDLYSSHSYYKTTDIINDSYYYWDEDIKLKLDGLKAGKDRFIFDEYGVLDNGYTDADNWRREKATYGTQIAIQQVATLNNGLRGSYLWTLMDQQWPNNITNNNDFFADGVHQWGLLPNYQIDNIPYPGFYAFQLMANYIGVAGAEVYACDYANAADTGLYATMVKLPDGNVGIAVVNANYAAASVKVNFEKALGKTLYRHQFDPEKVYRSADAEIIPATAKISNCKSSFIDVIPGFGIAVYTSAK